MGDYKDIELRKETARKWYASNVEKRLEYNRQWRRKNADKVRAYNREWHKANWRRQRNLPAPTRERPELCECCGARAKLHLDHCHTSGKFRGWLCFNCNVSLGKLGDSLAGVMRAIEYLKRAE